MGRNFRFAFFWAAAAIIMALPSVAESAVYNITDYGALGDGTSLNTSAIQKALDDCHEQGGGIVTVPAGVFVSGTIYLRGQTEFHLEQGAVLKASSNREDYCRIDAYEQNFESFDERWGGGHLIVALQAENVSITGPGLIDGSADVFLNLPPEKLPGEPLIWRYGIAYNEMNDQEDDPEEIRRMLRPGQLIVFCECRHIRVSDLAIQNSPCWCCFLHGCEDAFISGVKIDNPPTYPNSDGIDIDSCRNVIVSDCRIKTGDDAFAVRGNPKKLSDKNRVCENIVISNCVCSSASSVFRIGVGEGVIRDVLISNIIIVEGGIGIHLQSSFSDKAPRGAAISRVRFSNISMLHVGHPLFITPGTDTATAEIEDIVFEQIRAESFASVYLLKNSHTAPKRITFRNCEFVTIPSPIEMKSYPECYFIADGARETVFENVKLRWDAKEHWKRAFSDYEKENIQIIGGALLDPQNE